MRKIILFSFILILLTVTVVPISSATDIHAEREYDVLVIHSYARDYQWTRDIDKGIDTIFGESGHNVELTYVYMDTKNYPFPSDIERVSNFLDEKLEGNRYDAIIAADNNAMNYVDRSSITTFDNVPIIATAINGDINYQELNRDITLLYEIIDYSRFFNSLQVLHPDKSKIQVIFDTITPTSRYVLEDVESFAYLSGFTVEKITSGDIEAISSQIDPDAVLVFGLYFGDDLGHKYNHDEVLEALSREHDEPFYVFWDFLINHGGVGGYVLEAEQFGVVAAREVLTVLFDEFQADLRSTSGFKFDSRKVKRFNLDLSALLVDYELVNVDEKPWYLTSTLYIIILIVIAALMLLLSIYRFLKKQGSRIKELEEKVVEYDKNVQHSSEWLLCYMDMIYKELDPKFLGLGRVVYLLGLHSGLTEDSAVFLSMVWLNFNTEQYEHLSIDYDHDTETVDHKVLMDFVDKKANTANKVFDNIVFTTLYQALSYQFTHYDQSKGDIPKEAKILFICNSIYYLGFYGEQKNTLSLDEVILYLNDESGKRFDPEIIEVVLSHQMEIYDALLENRNLNN